MGPRAGEFIANLRFPVWPHYGSYSNCPAQQPMSLISLIATADPDRAG